jgi:hypothetical protein
MSDVPWRAREGDLATSAAAWLNATAGSQRRNVVFTRPFSQGNILNETGAIVCQVADKRKGALRARLTRAMRCLLDGTNIAEAKVHNLTAQMSYA